MALTRLSRHAARLAPRRRGWWRVAVAFTAATLCVSGTAWALFSSAAVQTNSFSAGAIAAATNFTVSGLTSTSAVLSWTPPDGYLATDWTVTQSPGPQVGCTGSQPVDGCVVTGLSVGSTYTWTLAFADGGWSAVTATTALTNTAAAGSSVSTTNGGVAGAMDTGDALVFIYSQPVDPATVASTFTGAPTPVTVCVSGGTPNVLTVTTATCTDAPTVNVGSVSLGTAIHVAGASWAQWPATMTLDPTSTVMTVSLIGGCATTSDANCAGEAVTTTDASTLTWTPSALVTDQGGTPVSVTTVSSADLTQF